MESFLFLSSVIFFSRIEFSWAADTIPPANFIRDGEKLVSLQQRFELEFFSPGNSSNCRYLGIWYQVSPETVVWVANRNKPIIGREGILTFGKDGNIVLLNQTKCIIWSSKASRRVENPVAQILDTGNFVLSDKSNTNDKSVWESFDYPSDTLLPGMKLGYNSQMGLARYLTSWRSSDDPSPGKFTLKFSKDNLPQLFIFRESMREALGGHRSGVYSEGPGTNPNFHFEQVVVFDDDEGFYKYKAAINAPIIMLLRLERSGKIQRLIWDERSEKWDAVYSKPSNLCKINAECGFSSGGSIHKAFVCECLRFLKEDICIHVPASELESDPKDKKRLKTILGVLIILGMFILCPVLFAICKKAKNKIVQDSRNEDIEVPLFDLCTIETATKNLCPENLIGAGGFGSVYKGILSTGLEIAVKRLSKTSGQDQKKSAILTWQKRFVIVLGIARGLLYLHQDSKLPIIHRDLKASNILLDNDLRPKISDFGLARIFSADNEEVETNRIMGTYGYMSPEYAVEGNFSVKSDVFSFGVLSLEIVSGKRNRRFSHPGHHYNLLGHAWLLWNKGMVLELLDQCLKNSCIEYSQVLRCVQIGLLCVQNFAEDRPAMSSVTLMLANMETTLPQPKQPGFFSERSSDEMKGKSRKLEPDSLNLVTITVLQGR